MGTTATDQKRKDDIKKLTDELISLRASALKRGVKDELLRETLNGSSQTSDTGSGFTEICARFFQRLTDPAYRVHLLMLLCALSVALLVGGYELANDYIRGSPCVIETNVLSEEIFRPVTDCEMCRKLTAVPVEREISPEKFAEKYAYTGIPVLIKDAISDWTAMSTFSFKFFQRLYTETNGALETIEENCQFFPYKTEFLTLADVLNMSDARASFQPGEEPWYIGWSNCHEEVKKKLRQHYRRPYFLPPDSESVDVDWIFMGGAGPGAFIHLDYVERPSWQAQISGRKTWQLVPVPECESVCHSLNVTVEKGDIIVIDTNIWYHSTFVHPGEISITIGSEFD